MLHSFNDYIRHGGNGEYRMARSSIGIVGHRVHLSLKSSFPNYSTLRQAFDRNLDKLISKNTQFLLNALTPPDTVPLVSEADLLDLSGIKDAALVQWDERVEGIYAKYHSHQQRLRPLRVAMEERLLRAFAGAINQIRQQDLGIERYIWRSRDDDKVRSAHAEYDDQTFRWDKPPAGGHPGQAHNCRCFAEPVLPGAANSVMLADFALPADIPGSALPRTLGRRVTALTPLGAAALLALEASDALQDFTRYMSEIRVRNIAEGLGLDLDTAEGLLAAVAHELVYETVISGIGSNLPKTSNAARIAGQAAALYEMLHPGTILKVVGGDTVAQNELGDFVQSAYEAFEANRLQILDGELAQGWVEVFPELTEEERLLGQLPGFTPERLDQFREEYPIEDLGLPIHTGHGAEEDPVGNIISTPIQDEDQPAILESRRNEPGIVSGQGTPVDSDWMRQGVENGGAPIPDRIADRLSGRDFGSFREFREAFWQEVAADPELSGQFSPSNRSLMERGFAPFAPQNEQVGGQSKFELDHIEPLYRGGDVYNVDNLQVVTPRAHNEKTQND